jgi:hypothetical protein
MTDWKSILMLKMAIILTAATVIPVFLIAALFSISITTPIWLKLSADIFLVLDGLALGLRVSHRVIRKILMLSFVLLLLCPLYLMVPLIYLGLWFYVYNLVRGEVK